MHPTELWWLIEGRRPPKTYGRYGTTEEELAEIMEDMPMLETL